MKLTAHFYLLNDHFSQEHADAQHNGEESENNYKIEWEDELGVKSEVSLVDIIRKGIYIIEGEYAEGGEFKFEIEDMLVFKVISKDGLLTEFACSEQAVDSFDLEETKTEYILKVYLKGDEPCINPIPGIYIVNQDFPEKLIG
ncbi:MAG: hypothetical protein HYR91_00535 [Flavobacteriia bacterium]|nr:hypothetical protein [Flavobacteriia bacterium]